MVDVEIESWRRRGPEAGEMCVAMGLEAEEEAGVSVDGACEAEAKT